MEPSPVPAALRKVRDLERRFPRVFHELARDRIPMRQYSAALDAIADTDATLTDVARRCSGDGASGLGLLHIYGGLQCLYVQQDSATLVVGFLRGELLRMTDKDLVKLLPAPLGPIRELRNQLVGHPGQRAGFIVQSSLGRQQPEYVVLNPDYRAASKSERQTSGKLDLAAQIRAQRDAVAGMLELEMDRIQQAEREHTSKWSKRPMHDEVAALQNAVNDIGNALWKPTGSREALLAAQISSGCVEGAIAKLEQAVSERGEFEAVEDSWTPNARLARHCSERLLELAPQCSQRDEPSLDAQAFLAALQKACQELIGVAREIDHTYETQSRQE